MIHIARYIIIRDKLYNNGQSNIAQRLAIEYQITINRIIDRNDLRRSREPIKAKPSHAHSSDIGHFVQY